MYGKALEWFMQTFVDLVYSKVKDSEHAKISRLELLDTLAVTREISLLNVVPFSSTRAMQDGS